MPESDTRSLTAQEALQFQTLPQFPDRQGKEANPFPSQGRGFPAAQCPPPTRLQIAPTLVCLFEIRFCYIAQVSLELQILSPLPITSGNFSDRQLDPSSRSHRKPRQLSLGSCHKPVLHVLVGATPPCSKPPCSCTCQTAVRHSPFAQLGSVCRAQQCL